MLEYTFSIAEEEVRARMAHEFGAHERASLARNVRILPGGHKIVGDLARTSRLAVNVTEEGRGGGAGAFI